MPPSFARRTTSRKPRKLHFLPALGDARHAHLPDRDELPTHYQARWKTVRLRPEIDATIAALQVRYRGNLGVDLSVSEVLAAALIAALPSLTLRHFKP